MKNLINSLRFWLIDKIAGKDLQVALNLKIGHKKSLLAFRAGDEFMVNRCHFDMDGAKGCAIWVEVPSDRKYLNYR